MQRLNPRAGTELHTPHTQVKLFQDWGWWPRGSGVQQRAGTCENTTLEMVRELHQR